MKAMGREVAIMFDLWLEGLDAFEYYWDRRRWGALLDPHLRLGILVAMPFTLMLWYLAGRLPDRYAFWAGLAGSLLGNVVWFGLAAISRARSTAPSRTPR